MLALAALGGSLLVGVSAAPAGALITITGHITYYSVTSLGIRDYPYAIAGTPSGDTWFITNNSPLSVGQTGAITRITTGGVVGSSDDLTNGGNWSTVNNLAVDSSGNAFLTDGLTSEDVPAEVNYSTMGLSYNFAPTNLLQAVTVQGTTPYWGSSPGETANELYSGFPTPAGVAATVAPVTALGATSGEVDMMEGTRDFGFYASGTVTTCFGGAQIFPSDSNIVNFSEGSAGLWFADAGENAIWQYEGSCTGKEYKIPGGATPKDITDGSDGNVYFTTGGTANAVWEFLPSSGVFYQYTAPGTNDPDGITLGSDGNIWFTDPDGHQVGKLVPYVASNPYATLNMWTLPTGTGATPCIPCHWMAVNVHTVPQGFTGETALGYVYQNPGPGLEALYACTDAGGQGDYLSLDSSGNCADSGVPPSGPPPTSLGIQGYVYISAPTDGTDALELYQCVDTGVNDWLANTAAPGGPAGTQPCGASGYNFDDALGYVVNPGPPASTPEIAFVPALALAAAGVMGAFWVYRRRRATVPPGG